MPFSTFSEVTNLGVGFLFGNSEKQKVKPGGAITTGCRRGRGVAGPEGDGRPAVHGSGTRRSPQPRGLWPVLQNQEDACQGPSQGGSLPSTCFSLPRKSSPVAAWGRGKSGESSPRVGGGNVGWTRSAEGHSLMGSLSVAVWWQGPSSSGMRGRHQPVSPHTRTPHTGGAGNHMPLGTQVMDLALGEDTREVAVCPGCVHSPPWSAWPPAPHSPPAWPRRRAWRFPCAEA